MAWPLRNATTADRAAAAAERTRLLRFYQAGLNAYEGDRAAWERNMDLVMREDGTNPYYLWFAGGDR